LYRLKVIFEEVQLEIEWFIMQEYSVAIASTNNMIITTLGISLNFSTFYQHTKYYKLA
jgi:hypothetical protein